MTKQQYLKNVRDQYESYPYPYRNPLDESKRLIEIGMDRLDLLNFYCFQGKCDFNNFRVLIAGGGTGDSTIFLAEQLKNKDAEIWYVDISESSMNIAKERAKQRGLTNINWLHSSLLSIDERIGKFDYISCTGVLHHLANPLLGLQSLNALLKSSGAMGLMLYGEYGRAGVYQMQQLMKMINTNENDLSNKVANTKKILANLPETNWFSHNEELLVDHMEDEDNGLVDLLLHEQDRAYSILEVYELLEQAALQFVEFSDVGMRMSYKPEQHIVNKGLLETVKKLSTKEQHGISELLLGAFKKHEFYVSNTGGCRAEFSDLSNIPFFFPYQQYNSLGGDLANAMLVNPDKIISMKHSSGFEFDLIGTQLNYIFFKHINGVNTLIDIFDYIRKELAEPTLDNNQLQSYFQPIYLQFNQLDWLLLKTK